MNHYCTLSIMMPSKNISRLVQTVAVSWNLYNYYTISIIIYSNSLTFTISKKEMVSVGQWHGVHVEANWLRKLGSLRPLLNNGPFFVPHIPSLSLFLFGFSFIDKLCNIVFISHSKHLKQIEMLYPGIQTSFKLPLTPQNDQLFLQLLLSPVRMVTIVDRFSYTIKSKILSYTWIKVYFIVLTEKSLTFLCDSQSFQVSFPLLLKRILMLRCKVFHQINIVLEESTEMLIWNMIDHCLGPVCKLFWSLKSLTESHIFASNFRLLQCNSWPLLVSEK